jgi:hypothetical protein
MESGSSILNKSHSSQDRLLDDFEIAHLSFSIPFIYAAGFHLGTSNENNYNPNYVDANDFYANIGGGYPTYTCASVFNINSLSSQQTSNRGRIESRRIDFQFYFRRSNQDIQSLIEYLMNDISYKAIPVFGLSGKQINISIGIGAYYYFGEKYGTTDPRTIYLKMRADSILDYGEEMRYQDLLEDCVKYFWKKQIESDYFSIFGKHRKLKIDGDLKNHYFIDTFDHDFEKKYLIQKMAEVMHEMAEKNPSIQIGSNPNFAISGGFGSFPGQSIL